MIFSLLDFGRINDTDSGERNGVLYFTTNSQAQDKFSAAMQQEENQQQPDS